MNENQQKHLITKETAAAYGSRGGKARAAKAARYKTLSEAARYLLAEKDKDGQTAIMQIINAFIDKAKAGDIKAAEFLRDLTEGKPTTKVKAEIDTLEAPKIIFDIEKPFAELSEMEKTAKIAEMQDYLKAKGGNA